MKKEVNNLKVNQKGYIERFEERNGKEDESNCYNLKNKTNNKQTWTKNNSEITDSHHLCFKI